MKLKLILVMILLAGLLCIAPVAAKFDQFGYNYQARIFNGPADGVDKVLDGKVWGDPTYAKDHLVMKWNAEWDRGKAEGWRNPPYAAWENNQWNGNVPGGSGEVWHYKIVWVNQTCVDNDNPEDGYCIWGQFLTISDHGTSDGVHEWLTKANPNGYGSYF